MVDPTLISQIVDTFVGVTTLVLATVAFYQSRLFIRERKARQMSERIYVPLRKELVSWLDPDQATYGTWPKLEEEIPYLTRKVQPKLSAMLNQAGLLFKEIWLLRSSLNRLITQASTELVEESRAKTRPDVNKGPAEFRVLGEKTWFDNAYVNRLWLYKKTLEEFAKEYMEKNHPSDTKWELEVMVSGQRVGGTDEAKEVSDKILDFLATKEPPLEIRRKLSKVKDLGRQALELIDKQIG